MARLDLIYKNHHLSLLVCLILVMLADFIHNIKKTGEELGKVSEHIACVCCF